MNGFDARHGVGRVLSRILALVTGAVLAFVPVFLVLFTDKGGLGDYVLSLALVLAAFAAAGAAFGAIGHRTGLLWAPWLVAPAAVVCVWLGLDEGPLWFAAAVVLSATAAALLGMAVGAAARRRRAA